MRNFPSIMLARIKEYFEDRGTLEGRSIYLRMRCVISKTAAFMIHDSHDPLNRHRFIHAILNHRSFRYAAAVQTLRALPCTPLQCRCNSKHNASRMRLCGPTDRGHYEKQHTKGGETTNYCGIAVAPCCRSSGTLLVGPRDAAGRTAVWLG